MGAKKSQEDDFVLSGIDVVIEGMIENKDLRGTIVRIAGPVVGSVGMKTVRLQDVVLVGELGLVGEVIRLDGGTATIQVYEETAGLRLGEPVENTGMPLVAELGPGLIGSVYDGLQRPLEILAEKTGTFIQRGETSPPLSYERKWAFSPVLKEGQRVGPGDILGVVPETNVIEHKILVPPGVSGKVVRLQDGEFTIDDEVALIELETGEVKKLTMVQKWPVRKPRPFKSILDPREPIRTGTRVVDTFFPVAKGGSAIIPGGFGTGKTVAQHSLSRWSDVDVVVYVGCGERGNEMTEVLKEFPKLEDARTGEPLINRTVLIANTSNMPVAARESSIYTGITIAEYYRDMDYDVLLLADSTSRWGEALREISGRLEEMPGEEGYPAYLAARIAEFYERSGRVHSLGSTDGAPRKGSVSLVGAVSPPGGDFSEPVTQNSMRVAGAFWALDTDLARRRHYPAINWTQSYSLYEFRDWYSGAELEGWNELTREAMTLLQRNDELQEIVQLVGSEALSESEQAVLFVAEMLREDFLQQSAFHPVDRYSPIEKTYWMLKTIVRFHHHTKACLQAGIALEKIKQLDVVNEIARMKEIPMEEAPEKIQDLLERVENRFARLGG